MPNIREEHGRHEKYMEHLEESKRMIGTLSRFKEYEEKKSRLHAFQNNISRKPTKVEKARNVERKQATYQFCS